MLLSEAFAAYARDVIVFRNQSKKTEENHYVVMKALIRYFKDVEIESLTFPVLREWKNELDRTRSPQTVRNYIIRLRVVLAYSEKQGLSVLPVEQLPVPQRRDSVPTFLSKEQVQVCIDSTKRIKNKAIIAMLYASGLRISELCALNRSVWDNDCFTVVGKGGRARMCFYDERAKALYKEYEKTRQDNNAAAFLSDAGTRIKPKTIQDTFITVRKQTGLDVHPHTLRHSFATNLLQSNTNLYHVSRMLGHRQLNTTAQYLHVIDHDLQEVYNKHHTT